MAKKNTPSANNNDNTVDHIQLQDRIAQRSSSQKQSAGMQLLRDAQQLELQREAQVRSIFDQRQQRGVERTEDDKTTLRNAMVPVLVKIDHCAYHKTPVNNGRTGKFTAFSELETSMPQPHTDT